MPAATTRTVTVLEEWGPSEQHPKLVVFLVRETDGSITVMHVAPERIPTFRAAIVKDAYTFSNKDQTVDLTTGEIRTYA